VTPAAIHGHRQSPDSPHGARRPSERHSDSAGREERAEHVTGVVEDALSRFSDRITRVEVHLSDQTGPKHGQLDKRCMMEVRLRGRQPTVVTHQAKTLDQAIDGAADKLQRSLTHSVGRFNAHD
jgi:ribosome-associated translation inhibitor RaiA